ncbi:Mic1 domain-containing protein [Citrus sinensis]|nr:Mic1 domain-containing protein [Citrus sinensis]
MSGKASSSSQPSIGLSGSGALSHVYIQYPPLRCSIPESRGLHYDDGTKLLISSTSNQIFSWKTVPFNPLATSTSDSIPEGPILSIRFSLDTKLIAIQRSSSEIQFWIRETSEAFSHRCRSDSENILGFFWTDCPLCDFVVVKNSGLDLFAYDSVAKSLDLVEMRKLNVCWYVYTHESRLVLLASGMQCRTFTGFQLSSAGIVRLPKFDMAMAKPEANSKPVLAAEDVYIVTVYGRIYCLQVDRVAMLLHSYRFYRDAVVQQGSLPIYSSKIAVSVVDNVLLVHQIDAKAIAASSSETPSVLEFLQRRKLEAIKTKQLCLGIARTVILERRPVSMVSKAIDVLVSSYSLSLKTGSYFKGIKTESTSSGVANTSVARSSTDVSTSRIDGTSIRHESTAGVDSEYPSRASTFSASESEENASSAPLRTDSRDLQLGGGKVDRVNLTGAQSSGPSDNPVFVNISEQQDSELTSPAISPDEMYKFVFAAVEEEMVGDPSYLVSIIVEFLRSTNMEKIKVHPNLYVLTIQLLARNERYAELESFVTNKILELSKEVALQLLESGRQNIQTRKLGLDMLRQLSLHHDYVSLLVQDGRYNEALRYARKYQVTTVRPALFLQAACSSNNSQHLAAVLRFFSDFIPDFRTTSDFTTYYGILNEMNTSVAATSF